MVSLRPRSRPQPAFTEPTPRPAPLPSEARTRTRQRDLELTTAAADAHPAGHGPGHNSAGAVTPAITALIEEVYLANRDKNRASVKETQARKKLLVALKDAGLTTRFPHTFLVDNAQTTVETEIATPEIGTIDVQKLRSKVSEEVFMKIISATVAAVTKHAGTNLMQECLTTTPGVENVTVKVPK